MLAVASCFALTLAAVAERWEAPLLDAKITATGHMGSRDDGHLVLSRSLRSTLHSETVPGAEASIQLAARDAEKHRLIAQALDVPVHVAVDVGLGGRGSPRPAVDRARGVNAGERGAGKSST